MTDRVDLRALLHEAADLYREAAPLLEQLADRLDVADPEDMETALHVMALRDLLRTVAATQERVAASLHSSVPEGWR